MITRSLFQSLLPPLSKTVLVLTLGLCNLTSLVVAAEIPVELNVDWNFVQGAEYPGAEGSVEPGTAENTMVLSYDFSGGGQYVAAAKSVEPEGELTGLELTASGPGGNLGVALVDNTDQTFIYRLGMLEDAEKTFDPALGKPSASYGGANDKTLHFPIKAIRLIVEKSPALPEGKITVSKIILRTP